jgi:hypothetical protein
MWMHNRTIGADLNDHLVAIASLKTRLFNSAASSLKLLLAGYYQGSVSFIRDILEIGFLLDYFTLDNSSIERWVQNNEAVEFRPVNIRTRLDKKDGLSEQKRKLRYKLLSTYGSHATFDGSRLFNNNNLLAIGPFFNQKFLENILFELAQMLAHPTLTCMKFESNLSIEDLKLKKEFFVNLQSWWKVNMGKNLLENEMDDLNYWFELLEINSRDY